MKNNLTRSFVAVLLLSEAAFSQLPESPAIWRDVRGIVYKTPIMADYLLRNPQYQRPHVPSFRTTRDGRIGINPKTSEFALIMPEKLGDSLLRIVKTNLAENAFVMRNELKDVRITGVSFQEHKRQLIPVAELIANGKLPPNTSGAMEHVTLFDPTPLNFAQGEKTNPQAVGLNDVYTIDVVGAFIHNAGDIPNLPIDPHTPGQMRLWCTTVKITVTNPKTTLAAINKIEKIGSTKIGSPFPFTKTSGLELNVVDDGKLIVMRLAGAAPIRPANQLPGEWYNIVYSYASTMGDTIDPITDSKIDPTKWTKLEPITHAPYDTNINTRLGFALKPFRDASGQIILDRQETGATYPWMDPEAKNLFMTVIDDTLRNQHKVFGTRNSSGAYIVNPSIGLQSESRYPHTPTDPGQEPYHTADKEDFGATRGVSFVGLWSNGKIVTIDNLNNDMDYQVDGNFYSRDLSLYSNNPSYTNTKLPMGGGRVNGSGPAGDVDNTGFIESMRNTYNYNKNAKPTTIRDVVWTMQNPKHTDELAFDDYLDRDALIVANMNGCVMYNVNEVDAANVMKGTLRHQSGFNGGAVKLQNAATPSATRWKLPAFGEVTGPGRLEPAAVGGFHGKGLWLNSPIGLKFLVPKQNTTTDVTKHNWYVGLFIDCRGSGERELIKFPDGSSIRIDVPSTPPTVQPIPIIRYYATDTATTASESVTIATGIGNYGNMIPDPGWAHLAWQIKRGGKEIDFLLNGMLYHRKSFNQANPSLFQMTTGTQPTGNLIVGNTSSTDSLLGFMGWIDDFKVIARTVDPESACNHAGGTLVGLRPSYPATDDLRNFNNSFPLYNGVRNGLAIEEINLRLRHNGQLTYGAYANLVDYKQDKQPINTDSLVVSMRQPLHFPEGPLHLSRPRPNSIKNQFCLTCHSSDSATGLTLAALTYNGAQNAPQDIRRTPLQPLRRIFGNIPAGLVTTVFPVKPDTATFAPIGGKLIDDYVLGNASIPGIATFSLVDGNTNLEIALLEPGQTPTVKRSSFSLLPVRKILIRANLNSSHGDVALKLNNVNHSTLTPVGTVLHAGFNIPYANELTGLTNITHTVSGTPTGGTTVSASFTLIP